MHFNFSVVAAKNYERKMLILEHQHLCKCRDARIVCMMPPRITIMIFVPMRGDTHRGRLMLLRTRTKAENTKHNEALRCLIIFTFHSIFLLPCYSK
jgi:hypothetical protein